MGKRPYSLKAPEQEWDVVVVGSGMGGMVAGALLAKQGKKVLVLEQHYVPGGFTHTFSREKWVWDVGVHAVGETSEHAAVGRVLRYLTGGRLEWASLGPVYEEFHFPGGTRIDFPDHPQRFAETLLAHFPREEEGIRRYLRKVREVAKGMQPYYLGRALSPRLARWVDGVLSRAVRPYLKSSVTQVLDRLTQDERLKTVLASQWGYYGATPDRAAFAIQALVARHFAYGAAYPVGGSQRIATELLQTIADHGGWTRVRAPVAKILTAGGRAIGVEMTSGKQIRASRVISGIGARETAERLLAPEDGEGLAAALSAHQPSSCHVCLYLGFEGDPSKYGAGPANKWFWKSWDREKAVWNVATEDEAWVLYVSFPSLKDPGHQGPYHTGEVVTFVPYETFAPFEGTRTQKRGAAYEELKAHISSRLLKQLGKSMPELVANIAYHELSTPLSTCHYARSAGGAIYGLEPTPERFLDPQLRPQTPIKGLYLAGCDVGVAGVVGAMMGGVVSALAIHPWSTLRQLMPLVKPPAAGFAGVAPVKASP